jgi:protease II
VLAIAHVRGGGRLGPAWHLAGRRCRRSVGASDTAAAARALLSTAVAAPGRLCLEASSAGAWAAVPALLDPRVCHRSQQLFASAVLTVPSLDPLSCAVEEGHGWHELGCPLDRLAFGDAVRRGASLSGEEGGEGDEGDAGGASDAGLPPPQSSRDGGCDLTSSRGSGDGGAWRPPCLLVRAGLYDTRAHYWEAAAFVAGVRHARVARSSSDKARTVLLRVKAGGHDAYDDPADDGELCAALLAWDKGAGEAAVAA